MDLDQMAYRCPKAEVVETVRLEEYRLTFAAAGSGLATIFPEEGSHVDGVLWSLTGDCEKSLDLYEGYPDFYDKQEITVKNKGGREIKAIVYIMTKDYMQNFNPPGRSYLTGILKGCRAFKTFCRTTGESLLHTCTGARNTPWQKKAASTKGCRVTVKFK